MSNYSSIKATIDANIKANNNQAITGDILNSVLNEMVEALGDGYQYMGIASTSTNPGSPDSRVFYVAPPGTYLYFGNQTVPEASTGFFKWDSSWTLQTIETGVADGSITEEKIADGAVTEEKLSSDLQEAIIHPVKTEDTNNQSDLEIADEEGYILAKFKDGHFQVKNFDSRSVKRPIKILFFGNSLTQDAASYVPLLLQEILPDIEFSLYIWYNAGATLKEQYEDYLLTSATCDIFSSIKTGEASWTNYVNNRNIGWVVANCDFDVLCLQEYSYYDSTDEELKTDWDNVANWFYTNYSQSLKVVSLIDAPNRSKVETMYAQAEHYARYFFKETCSEGIIPAGSAIYYALQTSLSSLGDQGGLSPDGTHAQEGLPCLLQAYVVTMWIIQQLGFAKSIFGSKLRVDTDVYNSLKPPGANLGTGVITGTEEQNRIAQECAIKAFKRGKTLEIETLTDNQ